MAPIQGKCGRIIVNDGEVPQKYVDDVHTTTEKR